MLTARTDTIDVVVGLECGADDYLRKPFDLPELVARVRALLRRAGTPVEEGTVTAGPLEVDPVRFVARRAGRELTLTATEFRLLLALARRPEQVFTRELLLERVWGNRYLVGRIPDPLTQVRALVHGYTVAFAWGAGLILLSGLVTLLLIKVRKEDLSTGNAVHMG